VFSLKIDIYDREPRGEQRENKASTGHRQNVDIGKGGYSKNA